LVHALRCWKKVGSVSCCICCARESSEENTSLDQDSGSGISLGGSAGNISTRGEKGGDEDRHSDSAGGDASKLRVPVFSEKDVSKSVVGRLNVACTSGNTSDKIERHTESSLEVSVDRTVSPNPEETPGRSSSWSVFGVFSGLGRSSGVDGK
jgi:hypothetical protein